MLKVRVDFDAAQPQLHHPGDLILPALHGGEEGAQADETVVLAHLTGDKVVDVLHLGRGGGGAGHGAAGNARLLLQCKERLHRGQVPGVGAVEAADGGRGLLRQLVGENVGVNICNRHGFCLLCWKLWFADATIILIPAALSNAATGVLKDPPCRIPRQLLPRSRRRCPASAGSPAREDSPR